MRKLAFFVVCFCAVSPAAIQACTTNGLTTTCTSADGAAGVAQDGGDGVDLPAPSFSGTAPQGEQRFEAGNGGSTSSPGFDGGNGADVSGTVVLDVVVPNSVPGTPSGHVPYDFQLYLQGGNGGDAGAGGIRGAGGDTAPIVGSVTGQNGADVNIGSIGGHGGNAGKSGNVDLDLHGEFREVLVGTGGGGGTEGLGSTTQGLPGDAGNVSVDFDGKADHLFVYARTGNSSNDAQAHAPSVSVVLNGEVTGNLEVESRYKSGPVNVTAPGPVTVRLEDNAAVGGIIINRGHANGRLEFAMQVATEAEYAAISATLSSAGANGIATVNGKTYEWQGFSDLANLIKVLQSNNPGSAVSVSVSSTSPGDTPAPSPAAAVSASVSSNSSGDAVAPQKSAQHLRRIECNKRGFFALVHPGRVELRGTEGREAISIGWLAKDRFASAQGKKWTVALALLGTTQLVADVSNASDGFVARCNVPRL